MYVHETDLRICFDLRKIARLSGRDFIIDRSFANSTLSSNCNQTRNMTCPSCPKPFCRQVMVHVDVCVCAARRSVVTGGTARRGEGEEKRRSPVPVVNFLEWRQSLILRRAHAPLPAAQPTGL